MQRSATELKVELLKNIHSVLTNAKPQGNETMTDYENRIEYMLIGDLGMSYEVARQYIDEAKKRI